LPQSISSSRRVILTDHPWLDLNIETEIFERAGIDFFAGPVEAPDAATVERMIVEVNPDAVITCWAKVNDNAVNSPAKLRVVARLGIGIDNIAVEAATKRGVWVTNVPDYCVQDVSDHAVALLLAHSRGIVRLDRAAKNGDWKPSEAVLQRAADLTVGIIGFGQIGRMTAKKLAPFGCLILAYSPSLVSTGDGVRVASLVEIQREADVIILHAPLTPASTHLVDRVFIAGCRKKPFIINVSRGPLIENEALLQGLSDGQLRGAALDVVESEPTPPLSILTHPAIIITPHVAFSSESSVSELRRRVCEEVVRVLDGEHPLHPCNSPIAPDVPLEGGVASDVRIVNGPGGPAVVKSALSRLRVKADWTADPKRSMTEVMALKTAAELLGKSAVPEVLWSDPTRHTFAMSLITPPFRNWKTSMLAGTVEQDVADRAGYQLATLHRKSAVRSDIRERFSDVSNFESLRVVPFFLRTAEKCADIGPAIVRAAEGMAERRSALVHGDYSPKNILTDGRDIVILDWEVAHWGDPRFDIAFCLSHLILKASRRGADRAALLRAADAFGASYRAIHGEMWDDHLPPLIGALLIARLDGYSPIDYLEDIDGPLIRTSAVSMLGNRQLPGSLTALLPSEIERTNSNDTLCSRSSR
jgi:D-3-phosphoglycerate dehydrogenase